MEFLNEKETAMITSVPTSSSTRDSLQSWGITVLRVIVGFVFLMHGWQKFFQYGLDGVAGALLNWESRSPISRQSSRPRPKVSVVCS